MESYIPTLLIVIPALPLLAAVVVAVLGKRVLREQSHWPVALALAGSCLASVLLIFAVEQAQKDHEHEHVVRLWTWAAVEAGSGRGTCEAGRGAGASTQHSVPSTQYSVPSSPAFRMDIVLRADSLTAIMLGMVTFISTLVVIYSVGYMHGDPGYWRFFAYVALFVFSMTMLVSVSNFVLLYVFWEGVGLCSYLLIGFWFEKPAAAAAGLKAFLVTRIGDCGFALGVFLLWTTFGTLNFHDSKVETIPAASGHAATTIVHLDPQAIEDPKVPGTVEYGIFGHSQLTHKHLFGDEKHPFGDEAVVTAICLLLLAGACGKSAQFPLHVWLPDAMEGPTPVSALIHAATMVTAGVYLVARCTPLYAAAPYAQEVVATIGGFTALLAALIALTQTDLKRILAYSTVSQLGYMFLALGTGSQLGVTAGMFHLFTHAFFKALLFLGAGSVMHAMGGVIDIRQFGGLRRKLPTTHWTFLFGCLALSGIIPFAGFWSKDAILAAVAEKASEAPGSAYGYLYLSGTITAFLTAFYTFRAYFLTFHGEERIPKEAGGAPGGYPLVGAGHAHESPAAMTSPLVILAIGALTVGAYFQATGDFLGRDGFLMQTPVLTALQAPSVTEGAGHGPSHLTVALISTAVALAGIGLAWLFYVARPDLAEATAKSAKSLGLYALSHGKFFIDEIYAALIVRPLEGLAALLDLVDRYVVDGTVNACGAFPRALGAMFRPLQGGLVQVYAFWMALGVLALVGALLW